MTIKIDKTLEKKMGKYAWLLKDCVNIIEEIKCDIQLKISFSLEETGYGNKIGRLILKNKHDIIVMKDYPYVTSDMKDIKFSYKDNELK